MSLFVELLRTRPRMLFWTMAVLQAVLWTLVPVLFYAAPPGQLPPVLAIGLEFQFGPEFGPPLAFWLAQAPYPLPGLPRAGAEVAGRSSTSSRTPPRPWLQQPGSRPGTRLPGSPRWRRLAWTHSCARPQSRRLE